MIAVRDPHTGAYFKHRVLEMRDLTALFKDREAAFCGEFSRPYAHCKGKANRSTIRVGAATRESAGGGSIRLHVPSMALSAGNAR
ncbi:MAG: hypothetical protein ACYC6Q_03780 [Syntrophales bacterium]